jgi:phage FluMu protein Com
MAIEVRCRRCGTILKIADRHAGALARCPRCQTEYTVPERTDEDSLDAVCHYCGAPLPATASRQASQEFKTCDECEQSIEENTLAIQHEQEVILQNRSALLQCFIVIGVLVASLYLAAWLVRHTVWF